MNKHTGFTLIELVIVIIVLGILAATAVPKFINLQDDAKAAAIKGAEAALNSAANIVYSKAAIDGIETTSDQQISVDGEAIDIDYGYPAATATGIVKAVSLSGFSSFPGTDVVLFTADNDTATGDHCLLYTQASDTATYALVIGKLNAAAAANVACTVE